MPRRRGRPSILDKKTAFLEAFVVTGSLAHAADAVRIERGMHYRWLKKDSSYAARFLATKTLANSKLSHKAWQTGRRIRALADIADGASDKLLIQIAELINASRKEKGSAAKVERPDGRS
jgi:hypothetical protein